MRRFEEQNNFLLLFRSLTSALFQTRQYYLSPHLSAETTWKKRKFEFHGCTFDIFSEAIHQKKMHMLWRISLYAGGCERGGRGAGAKLLIFLNADWVWRLPLEKELVSSTHLCLKNNPADLERWSIIPSSQFIIRIGPKDVSVICWNWIEITLIPMCCKITMRPLRYILYSLCKG